MSAPPAETPVPFSFLAAIFAAAIVVGAAIAYLGITGHLGAGIP
jgi:hypothetical protein